MRLLPEPSAQSLRLIFLLIFVMGVAPSPALTAGCPGRCMCDDQLVVQCVGQQLTDFPTDLPLATRQLIISNNRIGELPALQLNYLSDLVYLDCSNNSLTDITESTFGNLRKLAYLDLSFNILIHIDDRTFGPLASLVMLRMTDNPTLSEIHPDAFAENLALQVLDISRNNLTALNITTLIALPALRSLGISGNPWRCDCETEDLCLWVQIEGFKFQDEGQIVCQDPPDMMGQRLSDVGMQLRTDCHQTLGYWDYLFFIAIGFVIFSTGTVVAWVMGVFMVLCERYSKLCSQKLDREAEERLRYGRANAQGNGDLKKPGLHV
ncbi:leucine-rich repeat-containing protein 52-like [Brienomyrus brachyistius]|uniref:leucine-rich repeat-containing protein 52-like n=1 Tax=Brienomyrus brachyistius TaxID=42636 RepID=UPI0020B3332B|nr:leucine-rich repeat-containing protein 52-like [Brienomyrus brachyistius]XP_048833589.1 leucine-rich repeat-containing protein 52-like [Brienomyrus brachyistius]